MNDPLGNRMKAYEWEYKQVFPRKSYIIIRVDGKCFHTFTRNFDRPFDRFLTHSMSVATTFTSREMQGFLLGYTQSDEASFLITDDFLENSEPWFGNSYQKIVSVTASIFTYWFNEYLNLELNPAYFDARAFSIPKEDVPNYFVWRQLDWRRNWINMVARAYFSHDTLMNKNTEEVKLMLDRLGIDWSKYEPYKYGKLMGNNSHYSNSYRDYESIAKCIELERNIILENRNVTE